MLLVSQRVENYAKIDKPHLTFYKVIMKVKCDSTKPVGDLA